MTTKRALSFKHLSVIILFFISISSFGKDFYWINNGGNWNDQNHWSLTSGGNPCGEIPGSADAVIFDDESFDIYFPVINLNAAVEISSINFKSNYFPLISGNDHSLTIKNSFNASAKFDIHLTGNAYLIFDNSTGTYGSINTFGVDVNSNIQIAGNWELTNHLITGIANDIYLLSGSFKTNSKTVFSNKIIANSNPVNVDFTNSVIYAYTELDLSETINIGTIAKFKTTDGDFNIGDKPGFGQSSWIKTVLLCPVPSAPLQLDWSVTSDYSGADISCTDSCDGELTIIASGTAGPYEYSFNDGTGFGPFSAQTVYPDLCAGNYSMRVRDLSNELFPGVFATCTVSENVQEPNVIDFTLLLVVQPTCPVICDGQAFTSTFGGTGVLTTCWPNSAECTPNPIFLCTGTNPVIVTDENGCTFNDDVVINNPPPIIPNATITPPTCNGACDAEILLAPTGGNGGPYTFSWAPAPLVGLPDSNPAIGFCAGPVTASIFDVDGCQLDTILTITQPPVLSITAAFVANTLCFASCDGQATSTPVGGTGGYTFEWFTCAGVSTGITDQNPTTLCIGSFFVEVTDATGCAAQSLCIALGSPPALVATAAAYDMSCFGVCDGSVDVDISGGVGGYLYSWTTVPGGAGAGATDSLSGLCEGQFQIDATDANGCPIVPIIVEVFEPLPVTLSVVSTDPTCYDLCDGTATATAGGGVGGFTYLWVPAPGAGQFTPTPTAMCDGTYDITASDANGCFLTDQTTITNPPLFDITTAQTNLLCFGDINGTIDVTVNSGGNGPVYTPFWVPAPPVGDGTFNVSGLSAGVWTLTIEDPLFCDTVLTFTITSPPLLTVNASVISQVSCFGDCNGSAQVLIGGGTPAYTVLWDDPAPGPQTTIVAGGLCAGDYIATVTDLNGCVQSDNVTITEPGPFVLDTSSTDLLCFDACDAIATANWVSGGAPPVSYDWNDPNTQSTSTAFGLCVGTWTVVITDQNLCDTAVSFTVTEPTEIIVNINVINSACFATCSGSADVTAAGGTGVLTYQWFDAITSNPIVGETSTLISNLCPGDYYCEVTDGNGCVVQSATITITELPQIVTAIVSITDATCGVCDGTAQISVVGGAGTFTFDWVPDPITGEPGTDTATDLCSGVYAVNMVDVAGCTASIAVPINSVSLEVMTLDSVDASCFGVCDGQAIATYTSLDPPYTLEWFDNSTGLTTGIIDNPASNPSTATGLCNGDYLAVLTNVFGCVTTGSIIVNEPPQITAVLTPTDVTCNGVCDGTIDAVAAGGAGGFTYSWAPMPGSGQGTPNAGGLCDGNYTLTVTDITGCFQNFVGTVSEPVLLVINSSTSTDISCFGANDGTANVIAAGGIPALNYEWFDCNTGLSIGITTSLASNLGPGIYQAVVTDFNGCNVTGPCLPVIEPAPLTATINTSTVNCFGLCDGLMDAAGADGTAPYFYQWQDQFGANLLGQTNDTMNNVCQGIYNVQITDLSGCSITFGPIDMTAPALPWIINTAQTNITCSGSCDGTATVVVLGGNNPPYTYLWDDGPPATVIPGATNLCAGIYNVTISDAGICDTTISFTIVDNNPVFANVAITNVLCFGASTGQITADPFGGVPPYTVSWSDGQLGLTASNLPFGPITCSITDGNGCVLDTTINITQPTEMVVNSAPSNPSTCGVCNASATVNIAGGIPAYSYLWTPAPGAGQFTNNATGLCPGVIICDVTDQNGCILSVPFAISDINGEVVNVDTTDATCFGLCDGTADAIYVCGDPGCTNAWFDGTTGLPLGVFTTNITNLCAGDYFVVVTNNSGCVTTTITTINSPNQIIDNATLVPVTCNNDSDGSISLVPTGGSGVGYTYVWTPVPGNGQGNPDALNINSNTWDVDITDSDGCTQNYQYNVINPTPIIITPTPIDPSCSVTCNGSISIIVSGGYGGYTYQWTTGGVPIPGATGPLIVGLCSGNYNVEVTDINGCLQTLPLDITLSEPVPVSAPISGTDEVCFGDCNGTATVVPAGGFPPYLVNWYDSGTGSLIAPLVTTATNLCPGDYFAVITDNNGCNFTTPDQTINGPALLTFTLTLTDATCFGFCNGTGDLAMAGGTVPYTWEWLDILGNPIVGGTNQNVVNVCEGFYTVEGTDNNGCSTGVQFAVINGFPEITATVPTNNATCGVADGNATAFPVGGNPPYTYQWSDNLMVPIVGETASILSNVFSGTYFVTITDLNGCSQIFQADISDFSSTTLVWDNVADPLCAGSADGSISITANSANLPLSYTWNPGGIIAEDPTGLIAGDYTLQITDAAGCINFYNTTLNDPAPITASSSSIPSDCGQCNGSITLVTGGGTGGLSVLWNNGLVGSPISGLCSGVFQAQITDANGCVLIEPVDVANTGGLTSDLVISSITCAGSCDGQAVVSGVGGTAPYTYLWLHNSSTLDTELNLCSGTYFVTVTDAVGCAINVQVDMLDPNPITSIPTITNPSCGGADGSISVITADGNLPHSYLWSTTDVTPAIGGLVAGVYTLTVTDASGCSMDFVYGLNNANGAFITLGTTDVSCYNVCDGTIDTLDLLGGTAPFSFSWLDGTGVPLGLITPLITNLCDNDYILQVTDAFGCITFQQATITEPDTILLNPLFLIDPTCNGVCDGQIVSNPIGGTLPFAFLWSDTQTTFTASNLCDGPYGVTITDANGCQVNQAGTLTEPTSVVITVDNIVPGSCLNSPDGAIDITVSGGTPGYTYQWISQTFVDTFLTEDISGLLPLNYYLEVTDLNGCIALDTVTVDTLLVVIANAGPDVFLCFNDTLTLIGTTNVPAGMTYTWYDSLGTVLIDTNFLTIPPIATGNTSFIFEVSFSGCSHSDTVVVTMNGPLTVDAGPDIQIYPTQFKPIGGSPTVAVSDSTYTLVWSPPIYLDDTTVSNPMVVLPLISTTYFVTATDTNGCSVTDSVYVEVLPQIVIPDGISPDGNGLNETWFLDFLAQYPGVEIKINVYNRWGELLFESDGSYANDWGGTTEDGKKLPAGTYYYVIDIDHPDFPLPFTGPITIMW